MGSVETVRRRRILWILLFAAVLGGMAVWNMARPSPEARMAADFSQAMISRRPETVTEAEREEMRRQWERFSPEARRQIFYTVARSNLAHFREEASALTPEARAARIQEEIRKMRERRDRLTPEERQRIRERMEADREGVKEAVRTFMEFYSTELTAKERAELDPLVEEWFRTVEGRY